MLQLLLAVAFVGFNARYAGQGGARRYNALRDDRARLEHESFTTRTIDWLILFNVAACLVNAGLAGYAGAWLWVVIALGALMLSVAARVLGQSARANVNTGFGERQIEPLHQRETSIRRERRQKQFAIIAVAGYLTGRVLEAVAEQTGETWVAVPALLGWLIAAGGALALVWSMAWRFGDEQPA